MYMGTGSSLGEAGWQGAGFGRNASLLVHSQSFKRPREEKHRTMRSFDGGTGASTVTEPAMYVKRETGRKRVSAGLTGS